MRLPSTRPTTPSWHQAKGRNAAFLRRRSTQIEPRNPIGQQWPAARACLSNLAAWRIRSAPVTLTLTLLFLTSQQLWISGAIIVGGGTLLAMLCSALVRSYVALERLTINDEIA